MSSATASMTPAAIEALNNDRAWEETTIGAYVAGQPVYVNELRRAFERVQNPDGWKLPFIAVVKDSEVDLIIEAIAFYHADVPSVTRVFGGNSRIVGHGYQAD